MSKCLSVFDYSCINEYLKAYIEIKKTQSLAYSYRSLATRLTGFSHSQLYQIINGKKKFPNSLHGQMSKKILKLSTIERRYFKALLEINHLEFEGASLEEIEELRNKLEEIKPLDMKHIDFDEVTSHPITMILFEMIGRDDIRSIKDITPDLFTIEVTQKQINLSLMYLIEAKHIAIGEDSKLFKLVPHLMAPNDIPNQHLRNYHKQVSRFASETIDLIDIHSREYQSYAINLRKEDIPQAKELIRNFMSDFARLMEAVPEKSDSTYNLNLHLFPLTKVVS